MRYLFTRLALVLALCGNTLLAIADERLVLNGAYQHLKLNSPIYIGGLYLPQKSSDVDYLLSDKHEKQMRIVIVADVWRPNSWRRHWSGAIAVNNPAGAADALTYKALGDFIAMAQGKLEKGDEIVISYESGSTSVRLNGEIAITAQNVEVFNFLLKTWIGDVPPSSPFRTAILNGSAQEQSADFDGQLNGHKYSPGRSAIFTQWKKQGEQQELLERQRVEEEIRREADRLAREKKEAEEIARELAALEEAKNNTKDRSTSNANAKANAERQRELQAAVKRRQDREEKQFASELLGWQIQRYVNKHTRYPMWAERFGEEGLVNISFTLEQGGAPVFSDAMLDNESMLVREVKSQITNSLDQISIPADTLKTPQTVTITYLFSLRNEVQPELVKPTVPKHLLAPSSSPDKSVDAVIDYYRKYISDRVTKAIEYPDAARMLRQWGRVSAEFSINRWGEVETFTLTQSSRHKILNEAVEAAVRESAPFKPFPLQIFNESAITGSVNYTFR